MKIKRLLVKLLQCLMLFSAFVLLNCFALYMVSCGSRNVPMYDYADIYRSAYAYAYGGEVNWHYFALWSNNFSLFCC